MDVSVRGTIEGREALVVIECKNFDPRSTGPVGRGYVDALDSKRHDLNADFTIICSNSGFTEGALRKAKRKGIGMISVLRTSDHRVKAVIEEQMYLRRVKFPGWSFSYHGIDGTIKTFGLHQLRFMGCSVDTWLQQRAALIASANPTIVDRLRAIFNFRYPLTFQVGSTDVVLSAITVVFSYDTQWLTQTVQLDASLGLYDYLRGRVRVAPGEYQYMVKNVDFDTAEVVPPPSPLPTPVGRLRSGEMHLAFAVMCEGLNTEDHEKSPPLEQHVLPDDLTHTLDEHASSRSRTTT